MSRTWTRRLVLLTVAHFTSDAYSSFLAPLLPLLVAKLGLSLSAVGLLVGVSSITSSFGQPLFGAWADRVSRPWFVAFGPLLTAVFMSAVGLSSGFWSLAALVMLGGVGAAAFHPQAAVLAADASPKRAFAMSLFVTGGTLGFSLGPLVAVTVATRLGLEHTWIACLPGVLVSIALAAWFARARPQPRALQQRPRLAELRPVLRPLVLIYLCGVFRTVVSYGFIVFLPLLLHREGMSVRDAGAALTGLLMAGALGGFVGGALSARWGGRSIQVLSFALALPLHATFVLARGPLGFVCLVLGQFALQLSLPVNVVMGQELSPRHASTLSSLVMGAAWGTGMLLVAPIGPLADSLGLRIALLAVTGAAALGLASAWALPARAAERMVLAVH